MFDVKLKREPVYYDEYNQPCYPVQQEKGLAENQCDNLIETAQAGGYIETVGQQLLRIIKEEVVAESGGRQLDLLDIGGGSGYFFELVKASVNTYINIDPGKIVLDEEALKRLEDHRYQRIKCSAEELPLYDETVDVAVAIGSFDHIPDYQRAVQEINRVLKKGGLFIVLLNNRRSWWKMLLSRTRYLKTREEMIAREHYILWSAAELRSHLSAIVPVVKLYSTTFFPYVPKLWRLCLPVSEALGKSLAPEYGSNIIAVCRKSV